MAVTAFDNSSSLELITVLHIPLDKVSYSTWKSNAIIMPYVIEVNTEANK